MKELRRELSEQINYVNGTPAIKEFMVKMRKNSCPE